MSTSAGQALERARPQERALIEIGKNLPEGVVQYSGSGLLMIDLSVPALAQNCIVLAPSTTMMRSDPNFTPALTLVYLNPDPDAGDFYAIEKDQSGKPKMLALTKVGLRKLGDKSVTQLPSKNEYHDRGVTVTAGLNVRQPDGTWKPIYQSQDWISDDEYEATVAECPKQWGRGESAHRLTDQEKEDWIKKNWIQRRRSNLRVTESKAMNAAYREALPGIRHKYSPEELWMTVEEDGKPVKKVKPFLVVSTTFTPDTSNPVILKMMMDQGQQAAELLYGDTIAVDPAEVELIDEPQGAAPACDSDGVVVETHGEKPAEDIEIPRGPFKGQLLSDLARDQKEYVRKTFLKSTNATLGPLSDEWLRYWHGDEGVADDDFADVAF